MHCPVCGASATPVPTDEDAPTGGENVYAISKMIQERLAHQLGRATGIPAVALRYSCTYGPRQSLFNPYTGVIAIFCTRLVNDLPPVVYEDGRQSRDLIYVEDVARANLLVADGSSRRRPGLQRRHRPSGGDRRPGDTPGGSAGQADRAGDPRRIPPGGDAGAHLRCLPPRGPRLRAPGGLERGDRPLPRLGAGAGSDRANTSRKPSGCCAAAGW